MFDSIIAKEGQRKVLYAFIAFIVFILLECGFLTLVSFVIMLALLYIYRLKYIDIKAIGDNDIVSPISGKISAIDVQDFVKTIYIDVSLCDYHILRALESGECKVTINRGLNLCLDTFKGKALNEKATLEFTNTKMQLLSSVFNNAIDLEQNDYFTKGEKIGVFLHGQVLVTLNKDLEIKVNIGDKVISGKTLLAKNVS